MGDNSKYFPKRDYKIFAVDFDGTLILNKDCEPTMGEPNICLIRFLIKMRKFGNKVILWTCRDDVPGIGNGRMLSDAVDYCKGYGLEFDAINDNIPEVIEFYKVNVRKIIADYYIDDKAVAIHRLKSFVYSQTILEMKKRLDNPMENMLFIHAVMSTYGTSPTGLFGYKASHVYFDEFFGAENTNNDRRND